MGQPRFEQMRFDDGFDQRLSGVLSRSPVGTSVLHELVNVIPSLVGLPTLKEMVNAVNVFRTSTLMVGIGAGPKQVLLIDAPAFTLHWDKSALSVQETAPSDPNRYLSITALRSGRSWLVAKDSSGQSLVLLHVRVKPSKTLTVSFHLIWDGHRPPHHTARTDADVDKMLAIANGIFTPQTNIRLKKLSVISRPIPDDLGEVVLDENPLVLDPLRDDLRHPGERINRHAQPWTIFKKYEDGAADFNVFCVWKYAESSGKKRVLRGMTLGRWCILADQGKVEGQGQTLAHEAGHYLGLDNEPTEPTWLMNEVTSGEKIPWHHADVMNPNP